MRIRIDYGPASPRQRWASLAILAAVTAFVVAACTSQDSQSGQEADTNTGQSAYDKAVQEEPAHSCEQCQTRHTINFWLDTWNNPNALSYNYIGAFDSDGVFHASLYYVLKGLPVSYCTSLRPNFKLYDIEGDGMGPSLVIPQPASDNVYYSGGDCERYYGEDATTGAYVEFKYPLTAMVQTFSQPVVGEGFNNAVRVNGSKTQ